MDASKVRSIGGATMPRNTINGKVTHIRSRAQPAAMTETVALMSAKELRTRIAAVFPALPHNIQDAYVRLMEASLINLQPPPKETDKSRG